MGESLEKTMAASWDAVFRYLVGDLRVQATRQNVEHLHQKFIDRYENVCGEQLMVPSDVHPGDTLNENAYTRFNAALAGFIRGEGRWFVGKKTIYGPLIAERFADSLQGGRMCPAGSPAHTSFMLQQNYRSYAETLAGQGESDLSMKANLVVSRLERGLFVREGEIDVLRIIDALLSHEGTRMLGEGLLGLVHFEKSDNVDPNSQSVELVPKFGPRFVEAVRAAFTFNPDWKYVLVGVFRELLGRKTAMQTDWETAVIDEVSRYHADDDPLINSLLTLMFYGFGPLAQIFYYAMDLAGWSPHPVTDVLLHASASQSLSTDRQQLVAAAIDMTQDEHFVASNGDFTIPGKIAAFINYPVVDAGTENLLAELAEKAVSEDEAGLFLKTIKGERLVILFFENLQAVYEDAIEERISEERAARLVRGSVVARLLKTAVTRPLNALRIDLMSGALERMQGPVVNRADEVEYFLRPLYDGGMQDIIDSTDMTLQDFLDYYYSRGRNGSNNPGGASAPPGSAPLTPGMSGSGQWISAPIEAADMAITAAHDDGDAILCYACSYYNNDAAEQVEESAQEYLDWGYDGIIFGWGAAESFSFMEVVW